MIAAYGMYDMAAQRPVNDRFWQAIRARLGTGPDTLCRDIDPWEIWQSPDLLLAQTCGYPFRARLHGKVQLVGTPDYGLPDCPPGYYNSVWLVRKEDTRTTLADFAGARFAFNDGLSQSGWAAPIYAARQAGLGFDTCLKSGGHALSAAMVARDEADIAALDAQTWRLVERHDPVAGSLRALARTSPTPGLPLITAPGRDAPALADAVRSALSDLDVGDREALGIRDLVQIPAADYLRVPNPPSPSELGAESG